MIIHLVIFGLVICRIVLIHTFNVFTFPTHNAFAGPSQIGRPEFNIIHGTTRL